MERYLSVSEAARDIEVRLDTQLSPRHITQLFYGRKISEDAAPIIAGRRMIPPSLLPTIEIQLRREGKLPLLKKKKTQPAELAGCV